VVKEELDPPIEVQTWEEVNKTWLGAVEKEKTLVTLLFGMISIVAIFLIFCIFYMIVVEKTKDIGIIKSVGATSSGVAGIFLGYGLAIGLVGAGAAALLHRTHQLATRHAPRVHQHLDQEIYAFTIPNTMDGREVFWICVAVISSVLGVRFRRLAMNPVEAHVGMRRFGFWILDFGFEIPNSKSQSNQNEHDSSRSNRPPPLLRDPARRESSNSRWATASSMYANVDLSIRRQFLAIEGQRIGQTRCCTSWALDAADAGSIRYNGRDIAKMSPGLRVLHARFRPSSSSITSSPS
jgi:hypothetical protein